MSKFEAISEVLKSDGGPVIFGKGAITLLVGGYHLVKGKYHAKVKKGDASATLAPAQPTAEQQNAFPLREYEGDDAAVDPLTETSVSRGPLG